MYKKKKFLSMLLAMVLICSMVLPSVQITYAAQGTLGNQTKTMEITEEDLNSNEYETYYYEEGLDYTYQGKTVEFVSEKEFQADGKTYNLKNKKTETLIEENENGSIAVSLSNLTTPVFQIPGEWNSSFGGKTEIVYKTDIPNMEEVRTGINSELIFADLSDGVYHLTDGTIYEKANQYSPGHDFGNGKVTEGFFGTLPDITFTVGNGNTEKPEDIYLGVKTEAKVYEDFQNDIWLQYQQRDMKVGDTASLYPWRVEQIVSNVITNDVFRPNFHFEIISGDSVSLDTNTSNKKAIVTAEKPGTSVVKVTYDEADYKERHWGAISDVNTAYVVYTVGETGKATIKTNKEFADWLHYDTIYYSEGTTVPYEFTVDTENAESVKVTLNGIEIQGEGNKYTANLENRSNIIGIETKDSDGNVKSMYRVIDARFIEIKVENKTNPNQPLKAGDTANISFNGITMPVYKLATIYNPQMGKNATKVIYNNEKLGTFEGKCSQWDLATNNDFDVTFEEEGEYTFHSENGIHCTWWGSPLGSDITAEGSGEPNLNAPTLEGDFSVLPDFTVKVEGKGEQPETDKITATVSPENIYPGTEVVITFENLKNPETEEPIHELETRYTTDIPGMETITSKGAASDPEKLKTIQFTIPEETKPGEYHLTKGHVFKEWGGVLAQGIFWVGKESKNFYEGEMPEITVTVKAKEIPVESISILPAKYNNAELGETLQITATVSPTDATNKEVVFAAQNPEIADIDEKGLISTYQIGIAKFTATAGTVTQEFQLLVKDTEVQKVMKAIDELPPIEELTLDNEEKVTEARKAYDALNETAKKAVTNYNELEAAEKRIAELETAEKNKEAAEAVIKQIETLKETDKLTLEDKSAVEAARAAYDALTEEQRKLVDEESVKKLKAAEDKIAELKEAVEAAEKNKEAAEAVIKKIEALKEADKLTLQDKSAVEAARAAYNALTEEQKALVDKEIIEKLEKAEKAIKVLGEKTQGEKDQNNKNNGSGNTGKSNGVKTGDDTQALLYMVLMATAFGAGVIVIRHRKKEQ